MRLSRRAAAPVQIRFIISLKKLFVQLNSADPPPPDRRPCRVVPFPLCSWLARETLNLEAWVQVPAGTLQAFFLVLRDASGIPIILYTCQNLIRSFDVEPRNYVSISARRLVRIKISSLFGRFPTRYRPAFDPTVTAPPCFKQTLVSNRPVVSTTMTTPHQSPFSASQGSAYCWLLKGDAFLTRQCSTMFVFSTTA